MTELLPVPLERLLNGPPLTGRGHAGVEWHPDGRRFTYLVRRDAEPEVVAPADSVDLGDPVHPDDPDDRQATTEVASVEIDAPVQPVTDLWAYELESGRRELLVPGDHPGLTVDGRDHPLPLDSYKWLPDRDRIVLVDGDGAWLFTTKTGIARKLCSSFDPKVGLVADPTGGRLAFVRDGNVWVVDVDTRDETAITADGDGFSVVNGSLPWVYWEELAMRGRSWAACAWSPDGRHLAFLRFDLTQVPVYPLVPALRDRLEVAPQHYPSPGEPNPVPSVLIVAIDANNETGTDAGATLNDYQPGNDRYYLGPELAWTPDGASVVFGRLARDQRSLDVLALDLVGNEPVSLLHEADPHWLNHIGPPDFLSDGRFLWVTERSGRARVELRSPSGDLERDLSGDEVQVERIHGVHGPHLYFSGSADDARERHLFRSLLDGNGRGAGAAAPKVERLTGEAGVHDANWAPHGGWVLVTTHTPTAPSRVLLRRGSIDEHEPVEVHGPDPAWSSYAWSTAEFVDVEAADGTVLHGRLWRPPDFDPAKRYPVLVWVYGGPHAQVVRKTWSAASAAELFAQAGFLVWSLDGRGSWGRGHAFEATIGHAANGRLGAVELADQLAGVAHLQTRPEVDADRIGIAGSSYGGYLSLYALIHAPDVWACGIASAAVTNWRHYTSIYTERYLGLPADTGSAYDESSVLGSVSSMQAPLLIVQGTDDDNVHAQHTMQIIDALTRSRKPYELLLDVGGKHGLSEPARYFVTERMVDFLLRHLGRPVPSHP